MLTISDIPSHIKKAIKEYAERNYPKGTKFRSTLDDSGHCTVSDFYFTQCLGEVHLQCTNGGWICTIGNVLSTDKLLIVWANLVDTNCQPTEPFDINNIQKELNYSLF